MILLFMSTGSAFAQGSESDTNEWQFLVEPYAWVTGFTVEKLNGDDLEIHLDELIRGAEFATEIKLGAQKNKWGFILDAIYMDLGWNDRGNVDVAGTSVETDVKIDVQLWYVTFGGGYAFFESEKSRMEVFAGVSLLWEDIRFAYDLGAAGIDQETTFNAWDGLVGLRGLTDLSEKWYLSYSASIATGESDSVIDATLGVNYKFEKFTLFAGWRYLDFDMERGSSSGGDLIDGQYGSGPLFGFKWLF